MSTTTPSTTVRTTGRPGRDDGRAVARRLLSHWPVGAGLLAATALLASGAGREGALITLLAACFCYAAAAAAGRPWVAWAAIPAATAVVVGTEVAGAPWWVGLGVALVAVIGAGMLVTSRRPLVARQSAAAACFGAVAAVALVLSPTAALVVAGLGLATHGAWDVWHLARREVVSRSLAVACLALDLPLGLGTAVLALA